jgi:hypothetical protein
MLECVGRKGVDRVRRRVFMHAAQVLGNQALNIESGKVVDVQFACS